MAAIQVEGLVRRFGDLRAVDGIDLEVPEGEIYGFLGPNGAGKSTLVRMLCTLLLPTSGRARVAGFDVVSQAAQLRFSIGAALQEAALDDRMTGLEILQTQGRLFGLRSSEISQRIEELAPILDMGALPSLVSTYSGGMKRRLHIARALIHEPKFLILDEPTTGLDPQARHLVWQRLRELKAQGLTILLTTHYMEEAAQMCDRIGIMDGGKFLLEGPPQSLVQEKVGDEVYELKGGASVEFLDSLQGLSVTTEIVADILYLYSRNGMGIMEHLISFGRKDFLRRPATLEDLFLKLTGRELRD